MKNMYFECARDRELNEKKCCEPNFSANLKGQFFAKFPGILQSLGNSFFYYKIKFISYRSSLHYSTRVLLAYILKRFHKCQLDLCCD